jgi:hypothetical protein
VVGLVLGEADAEPDLDSDPDPLPLPAGPAPEAPLGCGLCVADGVVVTVEVA